MQYSLLIYQTDAQFAARTDPARREANGAAFMRYVGALQKAGVLVTTLGIEPPETATTVRYRQISAEALAAEAPGSFDVVTCLEMIEHVPDPASIVSACARLAKPGAHLFFSTINRNPKAWALAVVGAEYLLNLVPRGTHDYRKFIRPAELARAIRNAGLSTQEIIGMTYNPFTRTASLGPDVDVNYLLHAIKPDAA